MQQEKTQTKVLPREVQTIVPPRVTITVLPPRVPVIVTPLRVMTFRVPIISQKDPTEDRRQGEIFENKNQQRLKHRYTTRIKQLSQEINHINITATSATRHQYWLMNMNEQVKSKPQLIHNCLKYNIIRHPRTTAQHKYLTEILWACV